MRHSVLTPGSFRSGIYGVTGLLLGLLLTACGGGGGGGGGGSISSFSVTPSAGANGNISPGTPQTVNQGQTTSFTITPDSAYSIAAVSGCGGTLSGNTYTTGAITADCTVTASFNATEINANSKYSKIDEFGNAIAENSQDWSCVIDRETGLMWEVKTNNGGLRDKNWVYTAHMSTGNNGDGTCDETKTCNVVYFNNMVNVQSLCGYQDWRLPRLTELESLWDESRTEPPYIDEGFFKNTSVERKYWTDPDINFRNVPWVDFNQIYSASTPFKDIQNHVRLVREIKWTP